MAGRRPRQDSNLRTRFRRPALCPLSYEGIRNSTPRLAAANFDRTPIKNSGKSLVYRRDFLYSLIAASKVEALLL